VTTIDFGRSFVTFVTPGRANNARIQVEACFEWEDSQACTVEELFLVASCKSEDTYASKDLFRSPNYDFCGVFNEREYSIIRTHANAADDAPDVGPVQGRFERVYSQLSPCEADELHDGASVAAATLEGRPIVARTQINSPDDRYRCAMQYPVKTMNANDIRDIYQVDTGPVPFPDWEANCEVTAGRFSLAYVAFNAPHFADFVILEPTEIAPGVLTRHYSRILSLPAENELYALK